jgi:signal transduction histidine kinase
MVRYCRDEARRAVGDLRDEPVAGPNLPDSLREAVAQITNGASLSSRFEVDGKIPACRSELSSDLLRICQEATSNALQHAHANQIVVRLACTDGQISLSVEDDGLGMEPGCMEHPPAGHFGLLGMRERARRFGGELYLSSERGRGTKVQAVVPVQS